MNGDMKFVNGLIAKKPHERAPEFVKAKLSMRREELIEWLQQQSGEWVNADVKESRAGTWYISVDDWKPNNQQDTGSNYPPPPPPEDFDDDIPF